MQNTQHSAFQLQVLAFINYEDPSRQLLNSPLKFFKGHRTRKDARPFALISREIIKLTAWRHLSSRMARKFICVNDKLKKKSSSVGGLIITVLVDLKFYETPQKCIQEKACYLIQAIEHIHAVDTVAIDKNHPFPVLLKGVTDPLPHRVPPVFWVLITTS